MIKFMMCFLIAASFNSGFGSAALAGSKASETPSSRFILNEGETFDTRTKLTWSRCSVGTTWKKGAGCAGSPELMQLKEAEQFAKGLGGGWRVPTIEELCSLVDRERSNPALNPEIFPDVKEWEEEAPYLSVSRVKEIPTLLYYVDFLSGDVDGHSEGFPMYVRLVREKQ